MVERGRSLVCLERLESVVLVEARGRHLRKLSWRINYKGLFEGIFRVMFMDEVVEVDFIGLLYLVNVYLYLGSESW